MTLLNRTAFTIQVRRGLRANVESAEANYNHAEVPEGEPRWATDTHQLFVVNSTGVSAVQSLDMAVVSEDHEIVTDENYEMVHTF